MCNAINECNVLFSPRTVFSIGFSDRVFNEAYASRGNRPRGSVVKYTDSIIEGKEKRGILILVRLYVGSY
jgi:hypothetical protein